MGIVTVPGAYDHMLDTYFIVDYISRPSEPEGKHTDSRITPDIYISNAKVLNFGWI